MAGRHYQALREVAIDIRRAVDRFSDWQRDAIRRLRVIDDTLAVRLGVDALVLVHAVLLSGRSIVDASHQLGSAKASYRRMAFRLALDEIAVLIGPATKARPLPERHAVQAVYGHDDSEERTLTIATGGAAACSPRPACAPSGAIA